MTAKQAPEGVGGPTPGPWTVERHPHSGHPLVADEGGYVVADCCNGELETASEEANARLIAAAPELLEALLLSAETLSWAARRMKDNCCRTNDVEAVNLAAGNAAATIAKARGGSQ